MVRIIEARGVPVVCLKNDARAGYLGDALYDSKDNVGGFLVDGAPGFGKKFIRLEDILKLDKTACVIYDEKALSRYAHSVHLKKNSFYDNVIGKNVLSDEGQAMGVVSDCIFDMESGTIEEIELSRGFMEDIVEGRNVINLKDGVEFGEEFIIARGNKQ